MKKGVVVLASVLAAAVVYVAWTQAGLDTYEVKAGSLQTGNIKISLDLTGEVRPENQADIVSENGRISRVLVQEGDWVQAGDPLFCYDTAEAEKQLASARKELETLEAIQKEQETKAVYLSAGDSLDRYAQNAVSLAQTSSFELYHYNNAITKTLAHAVSGGILASVDGDIRSLIQSYMPAIQEALSSGVLPQETAEDESLVAVDAAASVAEQIRAARQNVDTLKTKVSSMRVTSAIAGRVLEVGIREGQKVNAGTLAMVVADTAHMQVFATVSGKDVKSLKTGMEAVLVSSDGSETYPAAVMRIGQKILSAGSDSGENMTNLVVAPAGKINELPGSSIDLEVMIRQKTGIPVLSLDCLAPDGSIFVVDEAGVARKRTVQKGLQDDYRVEITGGLKQGEQVILNPGSIKDGQRVKIVDPS